MMKCLILSVTTSIALAFSAGAQTQQVPVNPGLTEFSNFVFTVSTQATNTGTAFHLTITTKTQPIGSDCVGSLAFVTGSTAAPVVTGIKPPIDLAMKTTDHAWTIDFVAPPNIASDPTANFIFVVPDYKTDADGKRINLSTDRMYEVNLQSFLPQ